MQSLQLTSSDFAALAGLVSRLQDEDGLLSPGIDVLGRAGHAAQGRGRVDARGDPLVATARGDGRRRARLRELATGRLTCATGDAVAQPRPELMMRAQAARPVARRVAVEGGTTELTVTVSGDAMLENLKAR